MAGLVPAIHVFGHGTKKDVNARDEREHDGPPPFDILDGKKRAPCHGGTFVITGMGCKMSYYESA